MRMLVAIIPTMYSFWVSLLSANKSENWAEFPNLNMGKKRQISCSSAHIIYTCRAYHQIVLL
jgi:hypothetical protein